MIKVNVSGDSRVRIDEVQGPQVESFKKKNQQFYPTGLIKVFPSGCTLFSEYRKHVERIRRLKVLPDDVWIVTYPKCGTTWTQEMVWLLMNDLDFDKAKKIKLIDRSPFVEFACMMSPSEKEFFEMEDTVQAVESLKSPRCIKSHLPLELLPEQLWTVKPKIIYVTREPKDVAVSYYHHHRLWCGYMGSCEEFINAFLEGYVFYGSLWDHILPFWNIRNEKNLLINSFEEMKKDLPSVVQRTANFLNRPLNPEQLKQLCEHVSFGSMRKNPMVNIEAETFKIDRGKVEGKVEPFIRKGQVGGWKSDITPQLAEKIDKWTTEKLKGTDYVVGI